jgi:hypothetical protein
MELFKNSLTYPADNWKQLLILGVLTILTTIFIVLEAVLELLGIGLNQYLSAYILSTISMIPVLVVGFIVSGYLLSVTKKTIANPEGEAPEFELVTNIIEGIKVLILEIVYYIIPLLIILLVAYFTGAFNYFYQIFTTAAATGSFDPISNTLLGAAGTSFLEVVIVGWILYLIFSILLLVARAKLAETGSLGEAINMVDVFNKIGEIGWGNFIIWLIIYAIIVYLIAAAFVVVSAFVPIIGTIIAMLVISPFVDMFAARALGLIYTE